MNFKRQKNCRSPCALMRVNTAVSLMLLPPARLDSSSLSTLVSLTLITPEGESGCVTHGCRFCTREKVSKVGIAMRSGTLFCRELNIELQLDLILRGGQCREQVFLFLCFVFIILLYTWALHSVHCWQCSASGFLGMVMVIKDAL